MKQCTKWLKLTGVLMLMLGLNACVAWLAPNVKTELIELKSGQYQLDKTHARLLFKIQHLGLSTYVGRFNDLQASLNFDPEKVADAKLEVVVQMASLDINDESLTKTLMGREWFDQSRFPEAHFTTLNVKPLADNQFEFVGALNWRGVTKPISLKVTFHGGADNWLTGKYTLGFSATGHFKRSEFGMDSYIPIVGDDVALEVYAEFQKQ